MTEHGLGREAGVYMRVRNTLLRRAVEDLLPFECLKGIYWSDPGVATHSPGLPGAARSVQRVREAKMQKFEVKSRFAFEGELIRRLKIDRTAAHRPTKKQCT